jgi:general secretion pathway protein D
MKTQSFNWNKILGCALIFMFCATMQIYAQGFGGGGGRGGGGGFGGGAGRGGGGFGGAGFGGGGFGGSAFGGGAGGAARSTATATSEYNNNGTVGSAVITVDPDTHNLVITADPVTMEQIRNVIRDLDSPKPQVLIKVVFMEVEHNNSSDIGVEGGWAGGQNPASSAGTLFGLAGANSVVTNFSALGQPMTAALSPGSGANAGGAFYQIVGSDFQATLKAIAQAGKAEVLSRPSILARDGQPAQIQVGQDIYLPSGVSFNSVGTTGSTIPTINGSYQPIGIILNVTPFIGNNGLVQMILQPETTAVDTSTPGQVIAGGSLFSSPVFAPNIDVRSANTVVVTPDGQTVVIGGLIGNTKSSNESKVPFLGDIPVLGNLFKEKTKSDDKQELLIFLTPHIVEAPSQLAMMSSTETQKSELMTNSVSEQELDQYLDRIPVKKD